MNRVAASCSAVPDPLLAEVFAAHGGLARWQQVQHISGTLSTGGLAFALRGRHGGLLRRRIEVYPHQRRTVIHDYPLPGLVGQWQNDTVCVGPPAGAPTAQRSAARSHFAHRRAQWAWDELDLLYFVGYAILNYLSFPFLLQGPDVQTQPLHLNGQRWITARFAPDYPTHSVRQHFRIGPDALLQRHDYVASVFGRWAAAANLCQAHALVGGLRLYTHRQVVPSLGRRAALPFPTLVWVALDDLQVHERYVPPPLDALRG